MREEKFFLEMIPPKKARNERITGLSRVMNKENIIFWLINVLLRRLVEY